MNQPTNVEETLAGLNVSDGDKKIIEWYIRLKEQEQ